MKTTLAMGLALAMGVSTLVFAVDPSQDSKASLIAHKKMEMKEEVAKAAPAPAEKAEKYAKKEEAKPEATVAVTRDEPTGIDFGKADKASQDSKRSLIGY